MPDPEPPEELTQKEARLKAEAAVAKAEAELTKAKAEAAAAITAADPTAIAAAEAKTREDDRLKAEAAHLRAQSELLKAQAEHAAASKVPDPAVVASTAEKERLDAQKGALEAAKGVAEARKGADLAAAQAAIGTVTASGIEGTVTLKENAGKGEAMLLAARAVALAANKLAKAVESPAQGKHVVIMQGAEGAQFAAYRQFLLQQAVLERSFDYADHEAGRLALEGDGLQRRALKAQALKTSGLEAVMPTLTPNLTGVGVALDAITKLGSYFMSNYEIGGIGVTPDTVQLINAVAGRLLLSADSVVFPACRVPQPADFSALIEKLVEKTRLAETRATEFTMKAQGARDAASNNTANKEDLQSAATIYEQAAALLRKAITKAEEFIAGLTQPDAKGIMPISRIAEEKAVCDDLNAGALALYLDVRAAAGGYYTKKNLWTFLGAMPLYVMGGVVVTYHLVSDGVVKASGLIPIHGGYAKVSEVESLIESRFVHVS